MTLPMRSRTKIDLEFVWIDSRKERATVIGVVWPVLANQTLPTIWRGPVGGKRDESPVIHSWDLLPFEGEN